MGENIIMTTTDAHEPGELDAFGRQGDHETLGRSTWHRPELTTYGCMDGQTRGFFSRFPRFDGIYNTLS
jgi:hypothetical protein